MGAITFPEASILTSGPHTWRHWSAPEKHTFQYPSCGLWLQASGNSDVNNPGDLRCCQNAVHEEMLPGLIEKH
jgi:hypothetical protein